MMTKRRKKSAPITFPEHGVFTTEEAANYLRLSHQQLEISRSRGDGPPYVKLARAVRYRRQDLDQWLAERVVRSTAEASVKNGASK